MTYTQQSLCLASIKKKEYAEKTETAENPDPMTNLVDSLDRLTTEINGFLKEQPQNNKDLTDINQEAANAYAKLAAFYEQLKKKNSCEKDPLGRKK